MLWLNFHSCLPAVFCLSLCLFDTPKLRHYSRGLAIVACRWPVAVTCLIAHFLRKTFNRHRHVYQTQDQEHRVKTLLLETSPARENWGSRQVHQEQWGHKRQYRMKIISSNLMELRPGSDPWASAIGYSTHFTWGSPVTVSVRPFSLLQKQII